jgi:transglutaminase-like putative cysteine protease
MRLIPFVVLFIIPFNLTAMSPSSSIQKLIRAGELQQAIQLCDKQLQRYKTDDPLYFHFDSIKQTAQRIYLDFMISEQEIDDKLQQRGIHPVNRELWEKNGWLEYKIIDGTKQYFNRAAGNLALRLKQQSDSINPEKRSIKRFDVFREGDAGSTISAIEKGMTLKPHHFRIQYTLTVKADAVPAGEIIRCWLPWPKENHATQFDVKLIETNLKNYIISSDSLIHRTLYAEKKAIAGEPVVFSYVVTFKALPRWINPEYIKPLKYNRRSQLYQQFTREEFPHIVFSNNIRKLADEIVGNEKKPLQIVQKIYDFISNNIIWSGAQEYCIMEQIPEYVIQNRKGDCGMQTFLFMSLARYKGIPVRWQSGFMLHPTEENLHDWCEVYYEGMGWVPLDMSFQLLPSENKNIRNFYVTGLDAYRWIVNDGIAGELYPKKKYYRSEPFDFQRGEVEWKGGNLYFNQWEYDFEVESMSVQK